MPDLSEMLGNVYGGEEEEPAPAAPPSGPNTPAWSDDEHLDRAFAEWTPGPDADAPAAERSMFAAAPEAPGTAPRLADDLAAALSEAVLAGSDDAEADAAAEAPAETEPVVPAEAPVEPTAVVEVTPSTLADLEPTPEPAPDPLTVAAPVHQAGWQRTDDDIIPSGRSGRGGGRSLRPARAPRTKAPRAEGKPKVERKGLKGLNVELSFRRKK